MSRPVQWTQGDPLPVSVFGTYLSSVLSRRKDVDEWPSLQCPLHRDSLLYHVAFLLDPNIALLRNYQQIAVCTLRLKQHIEMGISRSDTVLSELAKRLGIGLVVFDGETVTYAGITEKQTAALVFKLIPGQRYRLYDGKAVPLPLAKRVAAQMFLRQLGEGRWTEHLTGTKSQLEFLAKNFNIDCSGLLKKSLLERVKAYAKDLL